MADLQGSVSILILQLDSLLAYFEGNLGMVEVDLIRLFLVLRKIADSAGQWPDVMDEDSYIRHIKSSSFSNKSG